MNPIDIFLRLLLSTLLGGAIGLERESLNRPAGFRTHILVCAGSALIMMVSLHMFELFEGRANLDPARIAAQVVSGIGFLGAGTIIREGASVKGLTTAASLWTVSGIGLASGSGFYSGAIIATVVVFITLISFGKIEHLLISRKHQYIANLMIEDSPGQIGKIGTALGSIGVSIYNIQMDHEKEGLVILRLLIRTPSHIKIPEIINTLSHVSGITSIEIDQ